MTTIVLLERENGLLAGFEMDGHSGYAHQGADIVCAALSVLAITSANALEKIAKVLPAVEAESPYMRVELPKSITPQQDEKAQVILGAAELGFASVASEYPQHVSISRRRCGKC